MSGTDGRVELVVTLILGMTVDSTMTPNPGYVVTTERLILRHWRESDRERQEHLPCRDGADLNLAAEIPDRSPWNRRNRTLDSQPVYPPQPGLCRPGGLARVVGVVELPGLR